MLFLGDSINGEGIPPLDPPKKMEEILKNVKIDLAIVIRPCYNNIRVRVEPLNDNWIWWV